VGWGLLEIDGEDNRLPDNVISSQVSLCEREGANECFTVRGIIKGVGFI
jgi:hypothetical protein